jgi:hypothetical protein
MRRSPQVPSGVIEASANIVREVGSVCVMCLLVMSLPCSEGDHLPFIDQGEGDLQACRTV